jgi:NADH:ubiquinone oxidoreductase subunit H
VVEEFPGTPAALSPVSAVGRGVVVVQVTLFKLKVDGGDCTRFSVAPLLVFPPAVTVTVNVPGMENWVVPDPDGTPTAMTVFDQFEALGTTVAEVLPWVKTT